MSGAGHTEVVRVLLEREELKLDQRDTEGFTALFHACNHGKYRLGEQHGYFRSWDLRQPFTSSIISSNELVVHILVLKPYSSPPPKVLSLP